MGQNCIYTLKYLNIANKYLCKWYEESLYSLYEVTLYAVFTTADTHYRLLVSRL